MHGEIINTFKILFENLQPEWEVFEYWLTQAEFINQSIRTGAGHSGRAVWGVGLGRLVAGIVGSNPTQGMDVCP
jgi:hypothetical protein